MKDLNNLKQLDLRRRTLNTIGELQNRRRYLEAEQKDILKEFDTCPEWHESALKGSLAGNQALMAQVNERITLELKILEGDYDGQ